MPDCPICHTIAAIGANPDLIVELDETFAILGENQGCPGWCVLLLKEHAEHLAQFSAERQQRIFADVIRIAAAIRSVFPGSGDDGHPPRINYECLGNLVPHIHWHLIPRHANDPDPHKPVWGWPAEQLRGAMSAAERRKLAQELRQSMEGG